MAMYTIRLFFLCVILILSPCLLASPTTPFSFAELAPRQNPNTTGPACNSFWQNCTGQREPVVLTWNNITSNSTSSLLNATPVAVKLGLPWWTSIPGGVIDFFIAFKSITFDWDKAGGISADEKLPITTFAALKVASQVVGLAYTFMQGFAGVIHVGLNQHRRKFMRYAGAGAYTLLFANAAKLWTKLVIRKPAALIVAWTNAILGMLAFIFFSLPDVGTKGLYQVWSPWCSTISSSLYACSTWEADNVSTSEDGSWLCANATSLVFDEEELVPIQFEWGFAGLVGLLLIVSAYKHIRFWANRERGIAYGQTLAGYIAYFLILAVVGFSVWIFYESYQVSKQDFITAAVTVCPGISNSTIGNISTADTSNFCQCVTVTLPGSLGSVKEALDMDNTNLARLLYNI